MTEDSARPDGTRPGEFATAYDRQSGEGLVYGGLGVALIGVIAAATRGEPLFLAVTAAGVASAFYFYPLTEKRRPVLGGGRDGLFIDGIGFIDWDAVSGVRRLDRAVRSIRTVTLTVDLNRPLDEAVARPSAQPVWRQLMTRFWRQRGQSLELQLHTLKMKPDAIIEHLRVFLPHLAEFPDR